MAILVLKMIILILVSNLADGQVEKNYIGLDNFSGNFVHCSIEIYSQIPINFWDIPEPYIYYLKNSQHLGYFPNYVPESRKWRGFCNVIWHFDEIQFFDKRRYSINSKTIFPFSHINFNHFAKKEMYIFRPSQKF